MRDLVNWQDHVVEHPGRFQATDLGDGLLDLKPAPGEVKQQGTPQNATNFNTMDLAVFEAMLIGNENTRMIKQIMRDIEGITGLTVDVTLTNSQDYPFNNSKSTVSLSALRNTKDYYVITETLEADGEVGEYEISDKLLNGFKLAFTGSAKTVKVRCHVIGGMYNG
ncbi:MAG: hypothetical protein IJ733_21415 [Lachnospiraceae bacterium]|nr:hypothetical protein [Lachnospiraceae bacterium]